MDWVHVIWFATLLLVVPIMIFQRFQNKELAAAKK